MAFVLFLLAWLAVATGHWVIGVISILSGLFIVVAFVWDLGVIDDFWDIRIH